MSKLSKVILMGMIAFASQSFAQRDHGRGDDRDGGFDRGGRDRGRYEQACFYEHANYTGKSFCLYPGERYRNLDGFFNDMISSISIDGRLRVVVYSDARFSGRVLEVGRDISNLSDLSGWNDKISSIVIADDRDGGRRPGPRPGPPRR